MLNEPLFTAAPESEPVWLDAVTTWNNHADGETMFYKVHDVILLQLFNDPYMFVKQLIEHLKTYYLTWKSAMNAKHTVIETYKKRRPIDKLVWNIDAQAHNAPPVLQWLSLLQLIPSSGLNAQSTATETDEPCVQYPSIPSSS